MKKEYTKPDILFESFSLSTSIAASCPRATNTPYAQTCSAKLPGVPVSVFTASINSCVIKAAGQYNGICYDVPTADNSLFNS